MVWCGPPDRKIKKVFFCYAPTHVDTHIFHRRKKKLDTDMFGAHLLNMKKNIFFLFHQHVDTCTPTTDEKKKLDANMFWCGLSDRKIKIFVTLAC